MGRARIDSHGNHTLFIRRILFLSTRCFCAQTTPKQNNCLRYRAGVAAGLAEIELICLRNGRVLPESEQDRLETAYLVYRSAALHMLTWAIAAKKNSVAAKTEKPRNGTPCV